MVGNQEGIGILKLECPQMHPVGRILKEAPYQAVVYDPGAQVGDRRFWPDEWLSSGHGRARVASGLDRADGRQGLPDVRCARQG